MSRGGTAAGSRSSLGYLFGDDYPAKPAAAPAVKAPPAKKPAPTAADVAKQIPASIPGSRANNYFRAEGHNIGNFLTIAAFGDHPGTDEIEREVGDRFEQHINSAAASDKR